MVESRTDRCSGSSSSSSTTTATSSATKAPPKSEELAIPSKGRGALRSGASQGNALAPTATAGGREPVPPRPPPEAPAKHHHHHHHQSPGTANCGSPSYPLSPASSGGLLPSPCSSSSSCSTNTNTLSASPPPPPLPSPGASGGGGAAEVSAPGRGEKGTRGRSPGPATTGVGGARGGGSEGGDVLAGTAPRRACEQPTPCAADSGGNSTAPPPASDPTPVNDGHGHGAGDATAVAAGLEAHADSRSSLPGAGGEGEQASAPPAYEGQKTVAASSPPPPPPPPRRAFFATSTSEQHQRGAGVGADPAAAANGAPFGFVLSGVKEGTGLQESLAAAEASSVGGAPATTRNGGVVNGGGGADGRNDDEGEASAAERLSRQVEALLARVEFLEKRRAFEGVGWGAGAAAGGVSRGGSGAIYNNRKGSEVSFLSEEGPGSDGSAGRGGALLVTPPPRIGGRHGSGDLQHALGVSTTPFTGLDVLFRTPKQPQEYHDPSYPQFHRHLHQPPLSPSRGHGQTRWAPAPIISTEQADADRNGGDELRRPRLTWSAGDGGLLPRGSEAAGAGQEAPSSPPHYSLGGAGGGTAVGKWALEGGIPPFDLGGGGRDDLGQLPRGARQNSRPRSATEGPAEGGGDGGEGGGGGGGGRGLFLSSRDSRRSDHGTYSPGGSTRRGSPKHSRSPRSPRSPRRSQSPLLERRGEKAGDEDGVAGKGAETGGDGGGGAGAFAEGGVVAGPISLLGYLRVEVFGAEDHGVVDTQANRTVRNFLTVPRQLERLLLFGMLVCLDTFLYVTTFLPIRIAIGLVTTIFSLITRRSRPTVNRPLVYDWMRGATIAAALCCLQFLEMSRVYHYIRGQAMVKLYVLIAMVEIFDKLMCSFGQDALDSLYLSTVHKKKRRVLVHFAIVCVTACLHSLLLFVHVTTLTVAVNSSDQALLTLLISNNFAEIKSSVFKKFDKHNLFQLSCHDVVERFKLALFLAMIMLLNVCQGGLDDPVSQFFTIFLMVFGGEVLADWIKHGFIIKFNQLTPSIYDEYSTILARDVAAFRKDDGSTLDHTHFVARRLAFATVPLNCVMIRFIQMAVPKLLQRLPEAPLAALWIMAVLFYLLALSLKVLTGITLMAHSCALHPEAIISSTAAPSWLRSPVQGAHKTRKELSLEKLSTIERFTLWKGRIV
eukprot:g18050.t1